LDFWMASMVRVLTAVAAAAMPFRFIISSLSPLYALP
jgi:hypothetical protein